MNIFVQHFLRSCQSVASSFPAGFILALLVMALAALTPAQALARDNHNTYVANNLDGTVDVIDTRTEIVTATIKGFINPYGLAVSPNGRLLYVRNSGTGNLSVVNTETNAIVTSINVGFDVDNGTAGASGPSVAFNRHGERAYLANFLQDNLVVINPDTNRVVTTLPLPAGFQPLAVAISPEGDTVFVGGSGGIMVVDADGDAPVTNIAPSSVIFDMALTPNGEKLYASNDAAGNRNLLVIDTDKHTVEATIPLTGGFFVSGLVVTPDGSHLYAANFSGTGSTVTVIDTEDNSIDAIITASGQSLTSLAITRDGKKVLAVNQRGFPSPPDSTVAVINTAHNTLTGSITVGRIVFSIATQPAHSRPHRDHRDDSCRDQDNDHGHHGR